MGVTQGCGSSRHLSDEGWHRFCLEGWLQDVSLPFSRSRHGCSRCGCALLVPLLEGKRCLQLTQHLPGVLMGCAQPLRLLFQYSGVSAAKYQEITVPCHIRAQHLRILDLIHGIRLHHPMPPMDFARPPMPCAVVTLVQRLIGEDDERGISVMSAPPPSAPCPGAT